MKRPAAFVLHDKNVKAVRRLAAFAILLLSAIAFGQQPLTLTIVHSNDLHGHAEPTIIAKKSYGGYARAATLIRQYRKTEPNVILLNAGDCFQGTLYFNTYKGLSEAAFMNEVGYNAMCLGNHEFDEGTGVLANFIRHLTFPVLCANIDPATDPNLNGLVQPSTVLRVDGQEVGVVGAVTPDAPNISSPGPNLKFLDLEQSLQRSIDDLEHRGINKIILLTHIGYEVDEALAKKLHGVDIIVGGHSHTLLGTFDNPGWPKPLGPYPTVVKNPAGQKVYIVQSWEWGKVLGHLRVHFDAKGDVISVDHASAVAVDDSIPDDPIVGSLMAALRMPIDALMTQPIGQASADISKERPNPMANLLTDAQLAATQKYHTVAAFINAGGVRGGFNTGPITYGEAISVQPFGNTLVVLNIKGSDLVRVLDEGGPSPEKLGGMLYPSKGTSYRLDPTKPAGSRVSEVVVDGKPLDPNATYTVSINNFTAGGGDSHVILQNLPGDRVATGIVDLDALLDYIAKHSPLSPDSTERVVRPDLGTR